MLIVFDIEAMWLNHKPEVLLDPHLIETHAQLRELIRQRLCVLADEMEKPNESYGIVMVHLLFNKKVTAVGFSALLAEKIEASFTAQDFDYWAKKVAGRI